MPRPADVVQNLSRGLDIPQSDAESMIIRTVPTVRVADLSKPEHSTTFDDVACAGHVHLAAVAGQHAECILRNPLANHVIGVLDRVIIYGSAAASDLVLYGWRSSEEAVDADNNSWHWRDSRRDPAAPKGSSTIRPSLRTAYKQSGASVSTTFQTHGAVGMSPTETTVSLSATYQLDMGHIIKPGWAVEFVHEVVNKHLTVSFFWRELNAPR